MRRPRASLVSLHPGGAGAPPGTTKSPCEELADGVGESRTESAVPVPKENAAMERRKAQRAFAKARAA